METYPEGIATASKDGRLALHVALQFGTSLSVVQVLLACNPEQVFSRDSAGTSLLRAALSLDPRLAPLDVVSLLVKCMGDSALVHESKRGLGDALRHALDTVDDHDSPDHTLAVMSILLDAGADCFELGTRGRSAISIARVSNIGAVWRWGRSYGQFLGRYEIVGAPVHVSQRCTVVYARDMSLNHAPRVALKLMRRRELFEKELSARQDGVCTLAQQYVAS